MTRRAPRRSAPVAEIADHPDTALEALPLDLARAEQSALRRISPLRNRWPEVIEFDRRAGELEQRAAAAAEELRMAMEERNAAPERDARARAAWIAAGERGGKPDPSGPELDRRSEDLERERDGLRAAADAVLAEKAGFVEKHRGRLVRDADAHVTKLRGRYERLVADLATTRTALLEARSATVWAAVYPDRSAGATPPATVAGGVRRVLERAGIAGQVDAGRIFELLREDAGYLARALTQEQAEAMGAKREDEAVWLATDEGREHEREDKAQARRRYRELWGHEPV